MNEREIEQVRAELSWVEGLLAMRVPTASRRAARLREQLDAARQREEILIAQRTHLTLKLGEVR